MAKKEEKFGKVKYAVRAALFISLNEYHFCDIVYHLQTNKWNKYDGWAGAKLEYYSALIGVGVRGLEKMRDRLVDEKGLLEKKEGRNNFLKVTQKWIDYAVDGDVEEIKVTPEKSKPNTNKVHVSDESSTNKVRISNETKHEQSSTKHEQSSTKHEQSSEDTYSSILTDTDLNKRVDFSKKFSNEDLKDFEEQIENGKTIPDESFEWKLRNDLKNLFDRTRERIRGNSPTGKFQWVMKNNQPNKKYRRALDNIIQETQNFISGADVENTDENVLQFLEIMMNEICTKKKYEWYRSAFSPEMINNNFQKLVDQVTYVKNNTIADNVQKALDLLAEEGY